MKMKSAKREWKRSSFKGSLRAWIRWMSEISGRRFGGKAATISGGVS